MLEGRVCSLEERLDNIFGKYFHPQRDPIHEIQAPAREAALAGGRQFCFITSDGVLRFCVVGPGMILPLMAPLIDHPLTTMRLPD